MIDDKELDANLQAPQEANTTKHINFLEAEEGGDADTNDNDNSNDSPTKKAWQELRRDQKNQKNSND